MATANKKSQVSGVDVIRMKTSNTIAQNQKLITTVIGIILALILAFVGYKYFVQKPNEEKAQLALSTAERYFAMDSFDLALNGDGQKEGFLKIAEHYGSTNAGNLARFYAGSCLLQLGQAQDAIKQLEKFNGKGTEFDAMGAGLLAAAYDEIDDKEKALNQYKKAIKYDNGITAPFYLRCASVIAYELGKNQEAIDFEKQIKASYPNSTQFRDADKHLALYGHLTVE